MESGQNKFNLRLYYFFVLATLLAGTYFTKWHVAGPLYMHDLLLLLTTLLILLKPPRYLLFPNVLIVLAVSIFYLILSLVIRSTKAEIMIRQFAIFGYLGCYYLLFLKANGSDSQEDIKMFLIRVGFLSLIIQSVYSFYIIAIGGSVFEDYNYFSPAVVLGLIIAGASILAYHQSEKQKVVLFGLVVLLSTTTGHSSAALSMLVMAGLFILFRINSQSKVLLIITGSCTILLMYLVLPQFHDSNAGFRLITWYYSMKRIILENYGLIGEGFGIPYFQNDLILDLYSSFGSTGFFGTDKINEPYLSSLHNSFLTIFLAIGLLPGILILYPFYRLAFYLIQRRRFGSPDSDFLYLSITGLTVWVMFNMILELPHSVALYWLTYFSCMSLSHQNVFSRVIDSDISKPNIQSGKD